jgi:hypothetical protein
MTQHKIVQWLCSVRPVLRVISTIEIVVYITETEYALWTVNIYGTVRPLNEASTDNISYITL